MAYSVGLSYGHHDSSAVVIDYDRIVSSVRYRTKTISRYQLDQLFCSLDCKPDCVYVHENKWRDMWRKVVSRDWDRITNPFLSIPYDVKYGNHHLSHAAYAYYSSPFRGQAIVIVVDAIGEMECGGVYYFDNSYHERIHELKYPHSLGLYYSYHTALVGLKPLQDEHMLMELSNNQPILPDVEEDDVIIDGINFITKKNYHLMPTNIVTQQSLRVMHARKAQSVIERYMQSLLSTLAIPSMFPIVLTGGVAMNSKMVSKLCETYTNIYVPKYPGDAGSAVGAVLQHTKQFIDPKGLYE